MTSEGTYEYECMRAELLGIDKPDYDEYMKKKAEREAVEKEALEAESWKESHAQKKEFQQISGKLDELNTILKSTQKKINNLTGPFSKFFKSKIGIPGSSTHKDESNKGDPAELESDPEEFKEPPKERYDIEYPLGVEDYDGDHNPDIMPMFDEIIEKYERSQIEMEYQRKQLRRFLNK